MHGMTFRKAQTFTDKIQKYMYFKCNFSVFYTTDMVSI